MSLHNHTWQGVQTEPAVFDQPGNYAGNGWSAELPQAAGHDPKMFAVAVQGSGVQVHGLKGKHGFRAWNVRHPLGHTLTGIGLFNCASESAGIPGSAPGSGGQGLYGDNLQGLKIEDFTCKDAAGHGLYLAATIHGAQLKRLHLTSKGAHNHLFQLNSQDGSGIFDVLVEDSVLQVLDTHVAVANLLGAGAKDKPIVIRGSKILGGTPLSVHIDAAPLTANRPSFIRFEDTIVEHTVYVAAGSMLWLAGSSKNVKTQGPGKVVKL